MATKIWVNIGSGNGLPPIIKISLKITYPTFYLNLPGANKFIQFNHIEVKAWMSNYNDNDNEKVFIAKWDKFRFST